MDRCCDDLESLIDDLDRVLKRSPDPRQYADEVKRVVDRYRF